jgi:periplasmic copper chaperone A
MPAFAAGAVTVEQPWLRLIIKDRPAAGYMTLRNTGDGPAMLTGASSPGCGMLMLHQSKQENGVEKMLHVPSITIAAHGTFNFAPGGYHLMCMQPQMQVGESVPVTLTFKNGQTVTAQFPVKGAGGK